MSESMDVAVAAALGWKFWTEERGKYTHVVVQEPGDREPWERFRFEARERERARYAPIDPAEIDGHRHILEMRRFRPSSDDSHAMAALKATGADFNIRADGDGTYYVGVESLTVADGGSTDAEYWAGFAAAKSLTDAVCSAIVSWRKRRDD